MTAVPGACHLAASPPPTDTDGSASHFADLASELAEIGRSAGLGAVGIAAAEVFTSTRADLFARKEAGLSAGMGFTYRNPERSTDPARILKDARTIVVGALAYRREESAMPSDTGVGARGRVARYFWKDNYTALRGKLQPIADRLKAGGWHARIVADDNALVDREAAYRAGIGWYGKNSLLLIPRKGSWFLLGSVVTDAPLPPAVERVPGGCGTCMRCMTSCPTGAIVAPGVVDARRCLAWLLQTPGDFPVEFRAALGDRVYGCDECQAACPPNRLADRRDTLPAPDADEQPWADLVFMVTATDDELMERFGRWYIPGRDPRYLRRNALVALGNTGDATDPRVEGALRTVLSSGDEMLVEHAGWAAEHLGRGDLVRGDFTGAPTP